MKKTNYEAPVAEMLTFRAEDILSKSPTQPIDLPDQPINV